MITFILIIFKGTLYMSFPVGCKHHRMLSNRGGAH
jgi:hypothetical protein